MAIIEGRFRWVAGTSIPIWAALIAVALSLPALWTGFLVDDDMHRAVFAGHIGSGPFSMFVLEDGVPEHLRAAQERGTPWWAYPELKRAFMRPVTVLTHMLDYALWPASPFMMHLHNLAWLAACVIMLGILFRRFIGPGWTAGVATLIFAVDESHAFPIFWIANRNALVGAFFYIACLILHDRWRKSGNRACAVFAPVALLAALLAVEGSLGVCGYLFAYALFLDRGPMLRRMLTLAPYLAVSVGWQLVYRGLGYGVSGSPYYADPATGPIQFLLAILVYEPFLMLAQLGGVGADFYPFLPPLGIALWWTAGVCFMALCAYAFGPDLRNNALARFFALGMVLSVMPSCAIAPADRLLIPSSVGAAGLVALYLTRVNSATAANKAGTRRARFERVFFVALIGIHLVLAPIALPPKIFLQAAILRMSHVSIQGASGVTLQGKTVISLDDPTLLGGANLHRRNLLEGGDVPARTYALAPMTFAPIPIRYTRTDAATLLVEFLKPYSWALFRDYAHPFAPGQRIELDRLLIEIVDVDDRGVPLSILCRFDAPLEDPSFVWLEYKDIVFQPLTWPHFAIVAPPRVGESLTLNE